MVMDYKHRDLMKGGHLDKDCQVRLSVSNPGMWNDSGRPNIGESFGEGWDIHYRFLYALDEDYSFNDLMEFLNHSDRRSSVAEVCDWEHCQPELDDPTPHDMLHLASDINVTFGLQTI